MQSPTTNNKVRNLLITIQYDGVNLHGWQIQKNALSVQEVFQDSLLKIIQDVPDIKGCSRTDSGVHANMYCISMKISHKISCERLKLALNRYLPSCIVCLSVEERDDNFHARYSCIGKEYIYLVWNGKVRNPFYEGHALFYRYDLDEEKLNKAAQYYVGKHDFTSFCTKDSRKKDDLSRTVKYFNVVRDGDFVKFTVAADGFLYNMVRIMVGTLLKIASGQFDEDCIPNIIYQKNRKYAGPTAPACGLYLNKVFYEDY